MSFLTSVINEAGRITGNYLTAHSNGAKFSSHYSLYAVTIERIEDFSAVKSAPSGMIYESAQDGPLVCERKTSGT